MNPQDLLDMYYQGLARREGWVETLAENFHFIGGDMTRSQPLVGRDAYVEVITRISRVFQSLRVVQSFVLEDRAFVLVDYDWRFPQGVAITGPVAELWTVRQGGLAELRIFFDTANFDRLVRG